MTTEVKSNTKDNAFKYGFTVHSISKVNSQQQQQQSPRKNNKKNKNKRNDKQQKQQQSSPPPLSIELYSGACSKLLDSAHLNAGDATSFHDLQCGTATFALQTFLEYPNF